ncbi:mannonate dehydratase [Synoicihabitans lomoniglobus]|uniref:mannonate dehydratase n=1 Tax=Synoicihabitans lomoniglobus TaxID=2909285 RepID=A0AAE9ZYP6_9BACT|nr:mannonate dehydratase [Opitutaceae bacterium LMO-M01]WED65048.1 mannonate dehydratase [Opitutaceae bacterium LMO-M01]
MKLGLGLYRHMLTPENLAFARQAGATHIVGHMVDYFRGGQHAHAEDQPTGTDRGWGLAGDPDALWTVAELSQIRREVEAADLKLEAIENFDPAHWHDILLDGPLRERHIENVKTLIRHVGEAGIPIIGYNFSIAGVAGRTTGPYARGGAPSVGMEGPYDLPMTKGMAWNMVVDDTAPPEPIAPISPAQLWDRLERFLNEVLPVAEAAGVTLAAHPDDPPTPTVRGTPRLVYQPSLYQKLIDINPSPANTLEFCVGSLAEMTEGDIYDTVETYARQNRLGYVHLRNVVGKVPTYKESFIDDGDIDVLRVMRILHDCDFDGVVIPDHAPQMSCAAPWHAGMAYALGFMAAGLKTLK